MAPDLKTTGLPAGCIHLATGNLTLRAQRSIARQTALGKWLGDGLAKASPPIGTTQATGWGPEEKNNSIHS